jgi:GNAT superfamily N-acetyltransferase
MQPPSIVVRRASDDDHELIIELHARSQLATYGGLLDNEARRRIPVSVREFWTDWRSAPAREGLLLVASCGETLAGFALCESTTHGMMLRSLHVDDVFRGRGIGSVLLEEIPNWCSKRGVLGLVLHVVRRNMAARSFYEAHGWRLVPGSVPHAIGGRPVEVVRYERLLDGPMPDPLRYSTRP